MLQKQVVFSAILAASLTVPVLAQGEEAEANTAFLREQGLEHSKVMDHLSWICDVYGPRLTGSDNLRRAQDWAIKTFNEWGLSNAHLEEWGPFGRGWQLEGFNMEVVGQNAWPVHAWPKAWSPSTAGAVEAEVVYVAEMNADDLRALDLNGKIVMIQTPREVSEPFVPPAKRHDSDSLLALADGVRTNRQRGQQAQQGRFRQGFARQGQMLSIIYEKKPLAILDRGSKGDYGTIFVSAASTPPPPQTEQEASEAGAGGRRGGRGRGRRGPRAWSPDVKGVVPQFTLAVEHYNRLERMLAKRVPVRMSLELKARFSDDDPMERNVIAEIPGTDPEIGDEVVMLGAHFDSWHSGTGATDNGAGSATMMEAIRLINEMVKKTGKGPRRTIRIALWSGEEQGLLGSRAYVNQHFGASGEPTASHEKISAYYNLDNGTGRIRGVYLQGNDACAPIFREWLQPFHDLDASTITYGNTGGTDHQAFDGVGIPGFQFIQDAVAYSTQTHHSNMDNWDHAVASDLQQASTIIAAFVWNTAQRNEKLPRKPLPDPGSQRRR